MFEDYTKSEEERKSKIKKTVKIAIIVILALLISNSMIKKVPVNSVGVKYSDFKGTISSRPLSSGVKVKLPVVEKITTVSTELRSANIDDIQVTTKDAQSALVDIELQYRILPENAIETFKQFRSTPEKFWIDTFVYQRIQRGIQEAASEYTISELRGSKRGEFQARVDLTVAKALEENHLTFHSSSVDDIEISSALLQVIEESAKAKQKVETAKQEKTRQEVENETKIAKAEAEATVKEINAKAEAEANKKLTEGISEQLVKYLEVQARQKHGWYKYNNMNPTIVTNEE